MKRKLIIITMVALVASACSTSMQTAGNYVDDIYYWPGDVTPTISSDDITALKKSRQSNNDMIIVSELSVDPEGKKTLNNYIYAEDEPDWFNKVQAYNLNQLDSTSNDTIFIPADEDEEYIVNNYYVDDEFSYADRIQRFHNNDFYYYDPYWNFNMGWNYYSPYSYRYYNYWDPFFYDPFYYSFHGSWYYGGWYGYNSWYNPYYYGYSPYFSYCDGGTYWGNNQRDYYNGDRRSSRPNTVYSGSGVSRSSISSAGVQRESVINKSASTNMRRSVTDDQMSASLQKSTSARTPVENSGVLTERRRSSSEVSTSRSASSVSSDQTGNSANTSVQRSASTPSTTRASVVRNNTYTPSYSTPRSNTRATYNRSNANYRTPSTSRSTYSSSSKSSIPSTSSSSSNNSNYRSTSKASSSKSYSSSATRSTSTRSTYTPPSRSYSSGSSSSYSSGSSSSYSSGGSSSSGSSSGGSRSSGGSSGSSGSSSRR